MSKISPIPNLNINKVRSDVSIGNLNLPRLLDFHEVFNFKQLDNRSNIRLDIAPEDRVNRQVLIKLFTKILRHSIDIIPKAPRDHKDYVVEASFVASRDTKPAKLYLPIQNIISPLLSSSVNIHGNNETSEVSIYVDDILRFHSDTTVSRLIIIASHELGHYMSFIHGNHDNDLKIGAYLMHHKMLSSQFDYLYRVFCEECIAWRFARDIIIRYGFNDMDLFSSVKNNSLKTYFKSLNLLKAPLEVFYKLSLLGEDFYDNCPSILTGESQ